MPSYWHAARLGYAPLGNVRTAAPAVSAAYQKGGARYTQSAKSGSRKRPSTADQIKEQTRKRHAAWEADGTTPRTRLKESVEDQIDRMHEGAQMLSDKMEAATNIAENRLAIAYTTQSTQQSRDRMSLGARERA